MNFRTLRSAGILSLIFLLTGCVVKDEPGLRFEAGLQFQGSAGENGGVTCEIANDPTSVELFLPEAELRLPPAEGEFQPSHTKRSCDPAAENPCPCTANSGDSDNNGNGDDSGNNGNGGSCTPGESEVCLPVKPTSNLNFETACYNNDIFFQSGAGDPFQFQVFGGVVNELSASDQEGTQSQFNLDTNKIELQTVSITFPPSKNNFPGAQNLTALNKTRKLTATVDTGGGTSIFPISIIREGDFDTFRSTFSDVVQESGGGSGGILPLTAVFRVTGKTLSGKTIESNRVELPILVCNNCDALSISPTCRLTGGG